MIFKPHAYQTRAIDFLVDTPHAALFMEMGLGKTVSVLSAFNELKFEMGRVQSMVVVAPLRVALMVWRQEAKKWDHLNHLRIQLLHGDEKEAAIDMKADIYVINYDGLKWFAATMKKTKFPQRVDMVVFDESTQVKNPSAIRSKVALGMSMIVKRRVILTGSPTPNNLIDMWHQIKLLDMGERLGTSFYAFKQRYFISTGYNGHKLVPMRGTTKAVADLINPLALTMKAEDYLNMPDLIMNEVPVDMSDREWMKYQELEEDFFLVVDDVGIEAFNAAALSMKLRQFVQGFVYDTETQTAHDVHTRKVTALREIVDGNDSPVLVAIQFRHEYEMICKEFGDVPVIYGGTSARDTMAIIDAWNAGQVPMLVAHPASIAHGVNLQAGGYTIVWFGIGFNLEHYIQFNARLHRQGQTRPVMVHHLIVKDTIDEAVMGAVKNKEKNMAGLVNRLREWRDGHKVHAKN